MEAVYNTSDITPMEPWTEQGWNALETAKRKREELRMKMSQKAREEQEKLQMKRKQQEEEKRIAEEKKQEEAKIAEEKKNKKGKKVKAEPKKEEERISLMPSKKELKRAEALRREKQREEAMRKKQEKEVEETPVVEEPAPVIEKKEKKSSGIFMKSLWVIILAIFIYLFREEIVHAFNEFISSLHCSLSSETHFLSFLTNIQEINNWNCPRT